MSHMQTPFAYTRNDPYRDGRAGPKATDTHPKMHAEQTENGIAKGKNIFLISARGGYAIENIDVAKIKIKKKYTTPKK